MINIKKENRGKFNATKKRTGKTTEQLTHSSNPLTRKRAVFAQNARKWHKHQKGGDVNPKHNLVEDNAGEMLSGASKAKAFQAKVLSTSVPNSSRAASALKAAKFLKGLGYLTTIVDVGSNIKDGNYTRAMFSSVPFLPSIMDGVVGEGWDSKESNNGIKNAFSKLPDAASYLYDQVSNSFQQGGELRMLPYKSNNRSFLDWYQKEYLISNRRRGKKAPITELTPQEALQFRNYLINNPTARKFADFTLGKRKMKDTERIDDADETIIAILNGEMEVDFPGMWKNGTFDSYVTNKMKEWSTNVKPTPISPVTRTEEDGVHLIPNQTVINEPIQFGELYERMSSGSENNVNISPFRSLQEGGPVSLGDRLRFKFNEKADKKLSPHVLQLPIITAPEQFLRQYINSPNYEYLSARAPLVYIDDTTNKAEKISFEPFLTDDIDNRVTPKDIAKNKKHVWDDMPEEKESYIEDRNKRIKALDSLRKSSNPVAVKTIDTNGSEVIYGPQDKKKTLSVDVTDAYKLNTSLDDIVAHELSHYSYTNSFDLAPKMSQNKALLTLGKDTRKMISEYAKKAKTSEQDVLLDIALAPNDFSIPHDQRPQEIKADLDAFRYQLYRTGIYNSIQGGTFDKTHLKKAEADKTVKDSLIFKRLKKQYSDDDLIWILNNIAQQEKSRELPIAQQGGYTQQFQTSIPLNPQFQKGFRSLFGKGDGNFKDLLKGAPKQYMSYTGSMINAAGSLVGMGNVMPKNPATSSKTPAELNSSVEVYACGGDLFKKLQEGGGITAALGGATGAAGGMGGGLMGGITKPLTNYATGIGNIVDSNKYNRGSAVGGTVGSVGDLAMNLIPGVGPILAQAGIGNTAGTLVGSLFDKDRYKPATPSTPSGNTAGRWREYQEGGNIEPTAEIEGDEFVFNPEGIDEQTFKMKDNTGTKFKSPFGFMVKGKPHSDDPASSGIKVSANDGYIASKFLGINGKKASIKNPSVSKLMINNGGKALSTGFLRNSDKFGVNAWNPGAVSHHLEQMTKVRDSAEMGKMFSELENLSKDKNLSEEDKVVMLNKYLSSINPR